MALGLFVIPSAKPTANSQSARQAAALGLIAAATLQGELVLTRLLSAAYFPHLAFVVLSMALLGLSAAGSYTSLRPARDPERPARAALGFAVSVVLAWCGLQFVAAEPLQAATSFGPALRLGISYLLVATPFFFSGLAVAAVFSTKAAQAERWYAADLAGSAAGGLLALASIDWLHGQDALLLSATLGAAAAFGFSQSNLRKPALALGALFAVAMVLSPADGLLPLRISELKVTRGGQSFDEVLGNPKMTTSTRWTAYGRVDRVDFPRSTRLVLEAGSASVRVPGGRSGRLPTQWPATDATLPYELRPGAKVLILGSGAGWEVAEALHFGASHIDAVEINPAVMQGVPQTLKESAKVRWHLDDARNFLQGSSDRYDAIVTIHTISNAASASGAMALAEDYLFTQEALRSMLQHLKPNGLVFVTRPESQLARLLVALRSVSDSEAWPDNVAVWAERSAGSSFYGAVLISANPLPKADRSRISARIAQRSGLKALVLPQTFAAPNYRGILAGTPIAELERQLNLRLDIATDNKPFFQARRRLTDISASQILQTLRRSAKSSRMALEDEPLAETSLVVAVAQTALIGTLLLLLPLAGGRARGSRRSLIYFAALGFGFMMLEVVLLQKMTRLLGVPPLAFATVLTALLLGMGGGSLSLGGRLGPRAAPTAALVAALLLWSSVDPIVESVGGSSLGLRTAVAALLSLVLGALLGSAFPRGLRTLADEPNTVAWAWAINGVFSVLATAVALLLAPDWGFSQLALLAAGVYALAVALPAQAAPGAVPDNRR